MKAESSAPPSSIPGLSRKPPTSRRVLVAAAVVMVMTFMAMTLDRRKARTGDLLVQCRDAKTRVVVRQREQVVIASTDRRSFVLVPGMYDVELIEPRSERASVHRIIVARGGRAVVSEPARLAPVANGPGG